MSKYFGKRPETICSYEYNLAVTEINKMMAFLVRINLASANQVLMQAMGNPPEVYLRYAKQITARKAKDNS